MKHPSSPDQLSTVPEDRLIDAVLHERARLGTGADEFLLTKIERELNPAAAATSRTWLRLTSVAAIAAVVALMLGIAWKMQVPDRDGAVATNDATSRIDDTNGTLLSTDLPPELIEGTPVPIQVPRLVGVPTEPPTMWVPEGTELLSRGKPVTSSDAFPLIGTLDLITDGEKDAGEGYYVELDEGLQWVQIDLEQMAEIQAIWVWHYHSQRRAYRAVIVQISDDPAFEKNVTTVFNNDFENTAGMGRGPDLPYIESRFGLLVDAKGTPGRYVRLYSNGNTSDDTNHYIEVEVFGVPR